MNCDGIDEVADFTASGGSHYFVGGKVNRVEDVTECFVGDGWEESEPKLRAFYEKRRPYLSLESHNMLLEPAVVDAALATVKEMGLRAAPTLVYLANRISDGKGDVPYSVAEYFLSVQIVRGRTPSVFGRYLL